MDAWVAKAGAELGSYQLWQQRFKKQGIGKSNERGGRLGALRVIPIFVQFLSSPVMPQQDSHQRWALISPRSLHPLREQKMNLENVYASNTSPRSVFWEGSKDRDFLQSKKSFGGGHKMVFTQVEIKRTWLGKISKGISKKSHKDSIFETDLK